MKAKFNYMSTEPEVPTKPDDSDWSSCDTDAVDTREELYETVEETLG